MRNATGTDRPVDWVARILVEAAKTDGNGERILTGRQIKGDAEYYYVDCSYQQAGDPIGDVNHDLLATDYAQMRTTAFREATFRYKNTEEGKVIMCEEMERFGNRREERGLKRGREEGKAIGALERAKAAAKMMLSMGDSVEKIVKCVGLPLADVEALRTA